MPLATPAQYAELLDAAKAGRYAISAAAAARHQTRSPRQSATPDAIAAAVSYGVVEMNVDSDTQFAYTRAVADHLFVNYAGVVRADCGIGAKCADDPRTRGRSAEHAMAARVVEACQQLGSAGRSLTGHAPRPRRV